MEVDATITLKVTVREEFGSDITYVALEHPARFGVGRGVFMSRESASWKIMPIFDLDEDVPPDGGERLEVPATWSWVLSKYMWDRGIARGLVATGLRG